LHPYFTCSFNPCTSASYKARAATARQTQSTTLPGLIAKLGRPAVGKQRSKTTALAGKPQKLCTMLSSNSSTAALQVESMLNGLGEG